MRPRRQTLNSLQRPTFFQASKSPRNPNLNKTYNLNSNPPNTPHKIIQPISLQNHVLSSRANKTQALFLRPVKISSAIPIPANQHEITVRILSNWGNPTRISMAEIDVHDFSHQIIPVKSISASSQVDQANLKCLIDRVLFNNNLDEIWSSAWSDDIPVPFEITLEVCTSNVISGIQIWPFTPDHSCNPRKIQVFLDGILSYDGEIRAEFSDVVQFEKISKESEFMTADQISKSSIRDSFGIIPHRIVQRIDFHILSGYSSASIFGLTKIAFFDFYGNEINVIRMAKIQTEDCIQQRQNLRLVLGENDQSQPWTGTLQSHTRISFIFHLPIPIAAIFVVNYLYQNEGQNVGLKGLQIRVNGKIVFFGKMLMRIPNEPISSNKNGCKLIFLTCHKELMDVILKKTTIKDQNESVFDVYRSLEKDDSNASLSNSASVSNLKDDLNEE